MGQTVRTILWDTERGRAVRSVWRPVPVSVHEVFHGVHIGDSVTVRVAPGVVVRRGAGSRFMGAAVQGTTASLNFYAEGRFPAPETLCTFTLGADTTNEIPYGGLTAERLQRELNALDAVTTAGGVDVEQVGPGHFQIIYRAVGAQANTVSAKCLGNGDAFSGELTAGDASTHAVNGVYFRASSVGSVTSVTGAMTTPSVAVAEVVAGDATTREIQSVTLAGDFEGGTFVLNDGSADTVAIGYDAPAGEVETALNTLLGTSAVSVEASGRGVWYVRWSAVGVQAALTGDAGGLTALQGVSAALDLSNAPERVAGGPEGSTFLLECTVGSGGTTETLFAEMITLGPVR